MNTSTQPVPVSVGARVLGWFRHNTTLNLLHVLNDGYQSLLLWMLPLIAASLTLAPEQIGRITSLHFLMGVITAVPAAKVAHRLGDEAFLLGAAGLVGVSLLLLPQIGGTAGLWALMLLSGCAFGVFHPVAFGLVSERASTEERAESLGWFAAIGDAGRVAVAGPGMLIAGWYSWRELSVLAGGLSVLLALSGVYGLRRQWQRPSTPPPASLAAEKPGGGPTPEASWKLLRSPRLARITLAGVLDALSAMGLTVFLPFVFADRALPSGWMAVMVAMFSGGSLLGKVVSGTISRRLGIWRALLVFQALSVAVLGALWAVDAPPALAVLSLLAGALSRSCLPLVLAETAESVGETRRRDAFGLNQMVLGAATSASPVLLGLVVSRSASPAALLVCAGVCCVNALLACTAPGIFSGPEQAKTVSTSTTS